MITVKRDKCHLCRGVTLDDAFAGPWVVCLECRQVQSRYHQREQRPDERGGKLTFEPKYNLHEDLSELE